MGIDCSGLAFMSYLLCGILIYRDARIMPGFPVREIPMGNPAETAKKGDLLFFPGQCGRFSGRGTFRSCHGISGLWLCDGKQSE